MNNKPDIAERWEGRDRRFLALMLIVLGVLWLIPNFVTVTANIGLLILVALGLTFLGYGLFARRYGFTIPGWILTGIGVGVLVSDQMVTPGSAAGGGVIVLGLAMAFFGIALMNVLFQRKAVWWPLVPGGILGVIGVLLTIDTPTSMNLLEQVGRFWPVILLIVGGWMLLRSREEQRN